MTKPCRLSASTWRPDERLITRGRPAGLFGYGPILFMGLRRRADLYADVLKKHALTLVNIVGSAFAKAVSAPGELHQGQPGGARSETLPTPEQVEGATTAPAPPPAAVNVAATPSSAPAVETLGARLIPRPKLARWLVQMPPATWAYLDLALVAAATYATYYLLVFGNAAYQWMVNPWLAGAAFCVCVAVSGMVFGMYERDTLQARSRILARAGMTLALGVALAYAFLSVLFYADVSRWLGLMVVLAYFGVGVPLRIAAHHVVSAGRIRLLCVGCGDSIRKTAALLTRGERPHYQVIGHVCAARRPEPSGEAPSRFVPDCHSSTAYAFQQQCPCLGSLEDVGRLLKQHSVDEVVVAAELASEPAADRTILAALEAHCRVIDQPTFIENLLGEVPAAHITAQWFLLADVQRARGYEAVKRITDVFAAIGGLGLTLPFWPLIALAIRLDSRGPALFKQARVGVHGHRFSMHKFRTMRTDAEAGGVRWAAERDNRVTRVGRFLRKSRLDELPQLWNILKGDMALVGPRPERPEFVELLARQIPHYEQRHLVKPGLTGWAQIYYRYGASVEDAHRKLCFDLYYLKHRALDMDLAIIVRTIGTFVLGAR